MTGVELSAAVRNRRARILASLHRAGFLAVKDLAHELGVSHMTVRRDLHALADAGQVRMVHGGASRLGPNGSPGSAGDGGCDGCSPVAARAAAMVDPGDTVVLGAGPLSYAMARALPAGFRGSVITNSTAVLRFFEDCPTSATMVALGGELLVERRALVGPTAEAALRQLRARTCFLAPAALDGLGIYARSPAEASLQRRMIEIADRVVLVVTHEVYGNSAPARIAGLDRLTAVVSDRPAPGPVAAALRRAGVTTHVATGCGQDIGRPMVVPRNGKS